MKEMAKNVFILLCPRAFDLNWCKSKSDSIYPIVFGFISARFPVDRCRFIRKSKQTHAQTDSFTSWFLAKNLTHRKIIKTWTCLRCLCGAWMCVYVWCVHCIYRSAPNNSIPIRTIKKIYNGVLCSVEIREWQRSKRSDSSIKYLIYEMIDFKHKSIFSNTSRLVKI